MVSFREAGSMLFSVHGSILPSQRQVASRASWFVPLLGICIYIFAIVDSSVEGSNVALFINSSIGLSLICYRLWPSLASKRIGVLFLLSVVEFLILIGQVLCFIIDSPTLRTWLGDRSIAGLVLDSLSLTLLSLVAWDKIPALFHNPSTVPLWRVPLGYQITFYIVTLSLAVIFNPSIFTLPFFVVLLWSLSELSSGVDLDKSFLGSRSFPRLVIGYCLIYAISGYALSLPEVNTAVANTGWIAQTFGVPALGNTTYNYSCVMPCGISLLCALIMAPWWAEVGTGRKTAPNRSRLGRASTRASQREDMSPQRTRRLQSVVSSVMDSAEDEAIVAEALRAYEERKIAAENREKKIRKYLKIFHVFILNFLFPAALIVLPLLLPATLGIPLIFYGIAVLARPGLPKKGGHAVQVYLTLFISGVFVTSVLKNGVVFSGIAEDALRGIGFLTWDNLRNVWDRFFVLLELSGLLLLSAMVNRYYGWVKRFPQQEPNSERALWKEAIIGLLKSAELGFTIVISVLFTEAAIDKRTSAVSVLYVLLVLPTLWLQSTSASRSFLSANLAILGSVFVAFLVGYAAWMDSVSAPAWLSDLGFPTPDHSSCLLAAIPHVLIALTGCMQMRLSSESVKKISEKMVFFFAKYPVFFSRIILLFSMMIGLLLFVLMPFDYFSAVVIVCFVVQMALLQLGSGFGRISIHRVILRVNMVEQFFLAVTLVWVVLTMIPAMYRDIVEGLSAASETIIPAELAILPNCEYLGKLSVVAALLVSGSFLWRHREFIEKASEMTDAGEASQKWISENPLASRVILIISSQLTRVLLLVIFLASVYQTTFLNVTSELMICVFLIIGYGWSEVGFLFSVVSMLLLFFQYIAGFTIVVSVLSTDWLSYLGLVWSPGAVARNIAIFVACISQRNVQHFVTLHFRNRAADMHFENLDKYAQVVIGLVLCLGATGRGNFFSLIYILMASGFIVRQSVTDRRLSPWSLRVVAIVVGICVSTQQLLRLWFPTVCDWCKQRPDVEFLCPSGLSPNELLGCKDDWQRFLNIPSSSHGDTALTDDSAARDSIAAALGFSVPYSISVMQPNGILWDFFILWTVCVLLQNHLLRTTCQLSTSMSQESIRSQRRKFWQNITFFLARYWIVLVEIFAVLSCFTFRKTVDLISVLFIVFLVVLAWSQEKVLRVRRRVVVGGIVLALLIVLTTIGYQIPVFKCKYWTADQELVLTGPKITSPDPSAGWNVPTIMCIALQRSMAGTENFGVFKWTQIAVQTVGFMKSDNRFLATPWPMTIGPPILLLAALLIQLALYDHSKTYARVNAIHFDQEFRIRTVRARRFVAEFNANLLTRNRQVSLTLEATKRKLLRVQQSADMLLSLFYERLAGSARGGLRRSETDHLSSETETVCARGYSPEEADLAVKLARDQPDGTALLILETASEFALNGRQESEVVLRCRALLALEAEVPAKGILKKLTRWLSSIHKRMSSWLTYHIDDVVFVSDVNAAEPRSLHRRRDGLLILVAKALFTNSLIFVVFFSVLAFVATNSVFDVIRVAIVLGALPVWPFASRNVWRLLLVYTSLGILIKAVYQLPVFCAVGIDDNDSFSAPLWRLTSTAAASYDFVLGCKPPSILGWDMVSGIIKMFGSSAVGSSLTATSLLEVVWQDALVLVALFLYRSFLHKAGVWEYLQVANIEKDSGAIIVPRARSWNNKKLEFLSEESAEDAATVDDREDADAVMAESGLGLDGLGDEPPALSEIGSPIGSFVDVNAEPLDLDDIDGLSHYAVQRHMGSEDTLGRLSAESFDSTESVIFKILEVYKRIRWEAQLVYGNQECVRKSREEREAINTVTQSGLSLLGRFQSLYIKVNPFYAAKVGRDYYVYFFIIGLMMFFHVIVFYSDMAGNNTSDFVSSLQRSQFSSGLALLMLFHFVLLIFDRAYYIASFRRSSENRTRVGFRPPPNQQVYWFFLRVLLLLIVTITLHAVIMNFLFTQFANGYVPLIQSAALAVYYLEFMLYLVIAWLQIKEGFPRLMKESLRPDKTYHTVTDKFQEIRFNIYRAIPFLDELRTLIDWTVSRSCLDLFQYFKLEDAHTYLWQTGREMEIRKKMWPAEPIGKLEKGFMGLGFLLLLMAIIIGPVLLFSKLVSPGVVAPLNQAALSVSLVVQTCPGCSSWFEGAPVSSASLQLYGATPSSISTLTYSEQEIYFPNGRSDIEKDSTVQKIEFEKQTETMLVLNNERYRSFVSSTSQAVFINLETSLTFQRLTESGGYAGPPATVRMPSCACKEGFERLCQSCNRVAASETSLAFDSIYAAAVALLDPANTDLVLTPGALTQVIRIDATGAVADTSQFANKSMAVGIVETSGYISIWDGSCGLSFTGICPNFNESAVNSTGVDPSFAFIMAPYLSSDSTGGSLLSIGIVTVYITIVYAIGRFLRLVFDKESLRVIYLEIPRPDDLVDLATGAATARHYKDLPMEFRLYNCLIKIMRSPETLIALGGADLSGYGARRTDEPPHPDLLSEEDLERIRRRRRKLYRS